MLITLTVCFYFLHQPVPSSSESEKDGAPLPSEHAPSNNAKRKRNEANGVTLATGLIPWEDESIQNVGFVTGKHGRKSQSPVISPGRPITDYKITEILRALSLVDRCV